MDDAARRIYEEHIEPCSHARLHDHMVCHDCIRRAIATALREVEAEAIKERSALYAALEDAQTQRVRESQANTDLARANRGLVNLIAHVTGTAPDSTAHYWPTTCPECDEVSLVLGQRRDL